MNKATGTGSIDRSARVRLIKRVIVGLIVFLMLVPSILCAVMYGRIAELEEQVSELSVVRETTNVVTDNTLIKDVVATQPSELDYYSGILKRDESDIKPQGTLKKVYLTFDDGPSYNTEKILDILKEYNVKATFFVIGREDESITDIYKRIVDEGHAIGMHSYSHIYNEIYASNENFICDLNKIQSCIYEKTGVLTDLYRFPGGSSNKVSKVPVSGFINELNNRGIEYFDWNVYCGDADSTYGIAKDAIVKNVINGALCEEEAVILMHDLPEKATTVEALPEIIEKFQSMGVEILPLDKNVISHHEDVK